jgi:hypothetical protein
LNNIREGKKNKENIPLELINELIFAGIQGADFKLANKIIVKALECDNQSRKEHDCINLSE